MGSYLTMADISDLRRHLTETVLLPVQIWQCSEKYMYADGIPITGHKRGLGLLSSSHAVLHIIAYTSKETTPHLHDDIVAR